MEDKKFLDDLSDEEREMLDKMEQEQRERQERRNKKQPKNGGNRRRLLGWLIYTALFMFCGWLMFGGQHTEEQRKGLSYTCLTSYIENNSVEKISVYDDNHVKATIRKEALVIVFGQQGGKNGDSKFQESDGSISAQIPRDRKSVV